MKTLLPGICLMLLTATGNKTNPDEMIRMEATWKAVNATRPSFINMKLLPQITDNEIKISQLISLLFKIDVRFEVAKLWYIM